MSSLPYPHLRVHSHYSLLRAMPAPEALVERAAADGLPALALTDWQALYGAVQFDRRCRAAGIRPLIGMTVRLAVQGAVARAPGTLVLLAMEPAGYQSLCRLSTLLQAVPQREQLLARGLTWEQLRTHHEGLLAIDGGRDGPLRPLLAAGDTAAARRYLGRLAGIYDERAYVGLTIDVAADQETARAAQTLGEAFGLPPVALHPVYALTPVAAERLPLLTAIRRNQPLSELDPGHVPGGGDSRVALHWQPPDELATRYAAFPEALTHTHLVADRCGDVLPDGRPIWPVLPLPAGETPAEALDQQSRAGLRRRFPVLPRSVAMRLDRELTAINDQGYAPLFLIVADIVRYARERGVPTNTRGSVANSLVAYALGITTVDPIEHDLLFERFLTPARAQLPDIDLDFCSRRRDDVLAYVRRTYGADHVALVATVNTMRLRSALRAAGKAYGLDERGLKRLSRRVRERWHPDPRRRGRQTLDDMLAEVEDPRERLIIHAAFAIRGLPDHLGVHPGGVVITPGPLTDVVPLQWSPKGFLITQYDYRDVERIGLPKLDLLGIRALTALAVASDLVRAHHDPDFRVEAIPLDDEPTAAALSVGDTIGVFQCESSGAQRTLRQLRARTVRDLAVANAFFKPGPATGGMAQAFIRRYRGEEAVTFLHPALRPILGSTQGVLLFQEQILRVAREIAGLSWGEADHLRRGMSKMRAGEMDSIAAAFIAGCRRPPPAGPGLDQRQAERLWEQVAAFAGYGFNQGHATAYADLSYRSAYVRTHWPAAFLAARLAVAGGFHHPAVYMAEALRLGMAVRPPHVNRSGRRFTLAYAADRPVLWMGLGAVGDLRRDSIRALEAGRPFADLRDLLNRTSLQHKEIDHLIRSGALDGLGESRAAMLAAAGEIERGGSARQLALPLGGGPPPPPPEDGATRLAWETELLGMPISAHPLSLLPPPDGAAPLEALPHSQGARLTTRAVRLPGWTGGKGSFFSDETTYLIARLPENTPHLRYWQPVTLTGRWRGDAWGGGYFAVERVERL